MGIIEIKKLYRKYANSDFTLNSIDLSIEKGEFVVIAGANGSGKSTLCKHLNGLLIPHQGSIKIGGKEVRKNLIEIRQKVGMIFQNADTQIVAESVKSDIAFGLENLKWSHQAIKKRVDEIAELVGLEHKLDQHPQQLSGGEKKRLVIAGVLAMNPEIVVFDEPFSNLDYNGIKDILRYIRQLHQSGLTLIIVTHELEQIIAHADRLIIMSDGCIAAQGHPADLMDRVENYGIRQPCSFKFTDKIQPWIHQTETMTIS